ncbi:protein kinase superfamily protein [Abortiporus biennis]
MATSKQNTRFSTLKVFKFTASKPPPPPPKDPYYLSNPSMPSLSQVLSPDASSSQPPTPLSTAPPSAMFTVGARSPSPSPSYAASQYTSASLATSPSSSSLSPESASSKRGLFKLPSMSFAKRPRTPKQPKAETAPPMSPPEPVDDGSISMPWNFQHNIHVDEGFAGLPPTWSASLSEMGFSEEEIAAIHSRRNAGRSPYAPHSLRSATSSSASLVASNPKPRTSSLRHDCTDASIFQQSNSSRPTLHSRNDSNASRQYSESSFSEANSSEYLHMDSRSTRSRRLTPIPKAPLPPGAVSPPRVMAMSGGSQVSLSSYGMSQVTRSPEALQPQSTRTHSLAFTSSSSSSSSYPSGKDPRPRTPPRRALHVANDSISTISSPPPAYRSPKRTNGSLDVNDDPISLPPPVTTTSAFSTTRLTTDREGSEENGDSSVESVSVIPKLTTSPPRLSLHQDSLSDLSSWTESLFSIIPGGSSSSSLSTPPRPTPSPSASRNVSSSSSSFSSAAGSGLPSQSASGTQRQAPIQKPKPLNQLSSRASPTPVTPSPTTTYTPSMSERTTPLFDEVMNMVRGSSESPAFSPPTPFSPTSPMKDTLTVPSTSKRESDELVPSSPRENENRDSNMSTITVTPATIVRHISVARRARANVIPSPVKEQERIFDDSQPNSPAREDGNQGLSRSNTPNSTESHSSESGSSIPASIASNSNSKSRPPDLIISAPVRSNILPYVESSPVPSPRAADFDRTKVLTTATVRKIRSDENIEALDSPSIVVEDLTNGASKGKNTWTSSIPSPHTPAPIYPGWVSEVVAPLRKFINDRVDPRELYTDLQEIAEGESGSVFSARTVDDEDESTSASLIAIKNVALLPSGSSKLVDLERELKILKNTSHQHILTMDAMYVDLVDDALWIKMELMDRSLADVVALIAEGIVLNEKAMARIAHDVLSALDYLQKKGIAHRDVRSDNLLLNGDGFVKLADFSNAVQVSLENPTQADIAGVVYWQAPEVRRGPYNALKIDVWSLGATVWEMAQSEPPFADVTEASQLTDRWPTLEQPEIYSRSFHDFLQLCSESSSSRPNPDDLLKTPFIKNASQRTTLVEILSQCRNIESDMSRRQSVGTISPTSS